MPQEVLLIRERFDHMGNHSGYDLLYEALEKQCKLKAVWFNRHEPSSGIQKLIWLKFYPKFNLSPFYSKWNFWTEVEALKTNILNPKIIHILYGENNYNLLGRLQLNNKIVVTIHQPIEWWRSIDIPLKKFFSKADQVIVLSKKEKLAFEEYAPGRVSFIPHGVDTDFFNIDNENKDNNQKLRCICVGQWFRDFNLLHQIIKKFEDNPRIEFILVIPDNKIESHPHKVSLLEIIKNRNTIWYNRISDNELKKLYQNSDVLLLPLEAATANNAILEAMACGLPVITSEIGGTRDYTHPSFTEYFPIGDVDGFVQCLEHLLMSPDKIKVMAKSARKFAVENFSWEIIAKKTLTIYNNL